MSIDSDDGGEIPRGGACSEELPEERAVGRDVSPNANNNNGRQQRTDINSARFVNPSDRSVPISRAIRSRLTNPRGLPVFEAAIEIKVEQEKHAANADR